MNARHTLATWLIILLLTLGASSEIVYSGIRNIGVGPFGVGGASLDVDGDGIGDYQISYGILATDDIPSSSMSGQVELRLVGETRVLGTRNAIGVSILGVLPAAFSVGAEPGQFSWLDAEQARFGVSVGSWSEGINRPWSGWTSFAGAEDPVFGIELHSSVGVRYGWVRLRFGSGTWNSTVQIYDWAYESEPGVPIVARAGTGGVITPPPPFVAMRRPASFRAQLSGAKAIPPSSSPLTASANLWLSGEHLSVNVEVVSPESSRLAGSVVAVLESVGERHEFTLHRQDAEHIDLIVRGGDEVSYAVGANLNLTPSLAQAMRLGKVHLKLNLVGREIRGQLAHPLQQNSPLEPSLAGEYSLLLWPPTEVEKTDFRRFPKGVGHGRLHVSANREVSLTATLPLGASIRWNGTLDETNAMQVTANVAGRRGSVAGEMRLELRHGVWVCQGELLWSRPADSEWLRFPEGFEIPLRVEGSRFNRDKERTDSCMLTLARGGLGSPITVALVSVDDGGSSLEVSGDNPHRVAISADPDTGVIRGSFRHPKSRVRIPFAGRLLGDLSGAGSFVSRRTSGSVTIEGLAPSELPVETLTIPEDLTPAWLNQATLTRSSNDTDVVLVAASGTVPDTSYELEFIPIGNEPSDDGIYDVVLNRYKARAIGLMVITTRSTTAAFLRPRGFKGICIHHAGGSTTLIE